MNNLFSVFDPKAFMGLSLNWVSVFIPLIVSPGIFWVMKSQFSKILSLLKNFLFEEFKSIASFNSLPGFLLLNLSLFFCIWASNFTGLTPYIFTSTSHLTLTLSLALPLWVGHIVYGWVISSNHMFAHLVPLGSPMVLAPFMVGIELTSALIRPLTLAVRLAANMLAGHLLMTLVSTPMPTLPPLMKMMALGVLILLGILESAVATIQAYVFTILTVLYLTEVAPAQTGLL